MSFLVFKGEAQKIESDNISMEGARHSFVGITYRQEFEKSLETVNEVAKKYNFLLTIVDTPPMMVPFYMAWLPTEQGAWLRHAKKVGSIFISSDEHRK